MKQYNCVSAHLYIFSFVFSLHNDVPININLKKRNCPMILSPLSNK